MVASEGFNRATMRAVLDLNQGFVMESQLSAVGNSAVKMRWTKIVWKTDSSLSLADASRLRGFLGQRWRGVTEFHHHRDNGSLIYSHPLIQTKVLDQNFVITGLAEGAMIAEALPNPGSIKLGKRTLNIAVEHRETGTAEIGPMSDTVPYTFITTWLCLNDTNYLKYLTSSRDERKQLIARILIGNILSMCKAVRVNVQSRLHVIHQLEPCGLSTPKSVPFLGFSGSFDINFSLPEWWGIGKFASRGFGTLVRGKSGDHARE